MEDCDNGALTGLVTRRLCSGSAAAGAAFTLVRCRDVAVSECQIIDPLHRGVELEDCERCRVSGNSIIDRRKQHSMLQAVRVRGKSSHNLVQNNLLGGAREKLLDIAPGSSVLQGNVEIKE